jgi:hypothetical protein
VQFDFYTFDEAVNYINDVPFNKNDYDDMISNIITLLNNHYIYLDIAKNPPSPFKPADVIKELKSLNTKSIKYYEFYQKVFTILLKLQDGHIQIFFKKILEFIYISPTKYYTKTINNTNYLFCKLIKSPERYFNTSLIKEINENLKYPIKRINDKDPFDFVQTFGRYQQFKSEHAQFTVNINRFVVEGQFHTYPFIKEDLTNIKIEFNNGNKINFDYKIFKPKIISRQLEEFYEKEMKKYSPDDIIKPTIIEIEQKFIEQNNKTRKLQQSFWDINYQGMIKLKVDHKNKVNVIFQNSFDYFNNIKNSNFDENIILNQKINQNNYPIIIIIDFSSGYYTNFEQIFM